VDARPLHKGCTPQCTQLIGRKAAALCHSATQVFCPLLPCCSTAPLHCCSAALLLYCSTALLLCRIDAHAMADTRSCMRTYADLPWTHAHWLHKGCTQQCTHADAVRPSRCSALPLCHSGALLFAALLPHCSAPLLRCCTAALLLCCSAAVLHRCTVALVHCCIAVPLHRWSAALLYCCTAALLHCFSATALLCCTAVLLLRCFVVLALCCSAVLLYCCSAALLLLYGVLDLVRTADVSSMLRAHLSVCVYWYDTRTGIYQSNTNTTGVVGTQEGDPPLLHTDALLPCSYAVLLLCCPAALLHCCTDALLHCSSAALLHCCTAALLHCCTAALLHCCTTAPLHHCTAVPLFCCSAALLRCCAAALLLCCSGVMLHCCIAAVIRCVESHAYSRCVIHAPCPHIRPCILVRYSNWYLPV
jgi:hypothetical protein